MRTYWKRTQFAASLLVSLGITCPSPAAAPLRRVGGAYSVPAQRSAVVASDSGLVIVPFAVPVAVPVATVQQPSVLYSYRQYAEPAASGGNGARGANVAPSPPTPLPQGERGEGSAAASSVSAAAASSQLDAAAVLARHCASCHRGSAAQGNLSLFDAGGALIARLPRQAILDAVEQGRMPQPPTAARLTAEELDLLRGWAKPPTDLVY